jgi:hypothetical protein
MTYIIIAFIALIVGVVLFVVLRKKKRSTVEARVLAIKDRRTVPSGLGIWVEDGADITYREIASIENGLLQCFAKARLRHYDRPLNLSDYIVAMVGDSARSPESHTWSYKIDAGAYAGSEWDLGGYILVAGQVIAVGQPYGNIIAIPDHHDTDHAQLTEVTMYEAEHIILANCDEALYESTKIHGQGQGHPLF